MRNLGVSMKFNYLTLAIAVSSLASAPAYADEDAWPSGPYVGVYGGMTATSTIAQDYWCYSACDVPTLDSVDPSGGITAGYNVRVDDNLIVGLEADFGSGSQRIREIRSNATAPVDFVWKANQKWQSTFRARAGLVAGKTTIFVSGGLAVTNSEFSVAADGSRFRGIHQNEDHGASWHGTTTGYAYGAGVEHSFGRLSAKIEYLHSSFGSRQSCYMDLTGPSADTCWDPQANLWSGTSTVTFTPTINNLRIGLNYRF